MSEENTNAAESTEGAAQVESTENESQNTDSTEHNDSEETLEDLRAERDKWKGFSRKNEDRAKENAEAAKQLEHTRAELQSTQEKHTSEVSTLTKDLNDARIEAAKYKAAFTHGLTPDDVELMKNLAPDEVDDFAERLSKRINATAPKRPAPDPALGRGGQPLPLNDDGIESALAKALNINT